ncbi:MAG: hypothetical protein QOF02_2266 [Blastocatellia bacterium]|nr:hypothetical protein [Blastocatellia bacterium]
MSYLLSLVTHRSLLIANSSLAACCSSLLLEQLAQNEGENAAVLVVVQFYRRVNAQGDGNFFGRAALASNDERDVLSRPDAVFKAGDVERLRAIESERLRARPFLELTRQDAHADQIAAMNALEALRDDGLHAEQARAFGRPVTRTARAVFVARKDDERNVRRLIMNRSVVDAHLLVDGLQASHAAFDAGNHQIPDADVGERAAHHHMMIAAPRAVGFEIFNRQAALL